MSDRAQTEPEFCFELRFYQGYCVLCTGIMPPETSSDGCRSCARKVVKRPQLFARALEGVRAHGFKGTALELSQRIEILARDPPMGYRREAGRTGDETGRVP